MVDLYKQVKNIIRHHKHEGMYFLILLVRTDL